MARTAMSAPFVARAAEVRRVTDALARARNGDPSLLLVAGDAGVGKTRFLEHVAELSRAAGARVVVGHCVDFGEIGLPYLPFAEVLGAVQALDPAALDSVVADHPALRLLLPGAGAAPDEGDDRRQLFEGYAEALELAGTPERPLVVVLEDLHWADASSRDLLRFLVARLAEQHLLLAGSYRTDDLHRRHPFRPVTAELARHPRVERIDLGPFTPDELGQFATSIVGQPLARATLDRVQERSEGNAYFAVELIEAGPDDDALPWSLADVLHARLDPLDPAVHHLVQVVAAAGRRVAEPLLRAAVAAHGNPDLAAPGALDEALRDAIAHHVLREVDGQIAFRHALLAEVVYGDLLPGEKSSLHRAYLRALQEQPELGSPAELASHATLAPDLDVALAASWDAAAAAAAVLAPQERLRHLEVVLRLWDAAPKAAAALGTDRAGVAEAAAVAAADTGATEHAIALRRAAMELVADDLARCATIRTPLARLLLVAEKPREARAEATHAVADLPDPSPERARALATSAWVALNTDQDEEAAAVAAQALELAGQVGAADAEADAITTLALLETHSFQRAETMIREALERAVAGRDGDGELRARYALASDRYSAGDVPGALAIAQEGLARAQLLGLEWSMYGLELHWLADVIRYASGDLRPTPGSTGPVRGWEGPATWLKVAGLPAAVARGEDDAIARGRALLPEWHRDAVILHLTGGAVVDALTWAGRYDEAVELANQVIEDLSRTWSEHFLGGIQHSALALAALADAAQSDRLHGADPGPRVAAGDVLAKRALSTAEHGRPRGGELGPEGRGWLARAEAEHARLRGRNDPALWERNVEEFGTGYRYEAARSRWRWAEALLGAGERARARDEAATALAEAEAMGAAPLAEAVRALARRGRLDLPGVRLAGADVLTAREAEVLALVAQGLTNRMIGERLFVSEKTVSVHVSNLLAKLGASGRAEAVAIAHQRGLLSP